MRLGRAAAAMAVGLALVLALATPARAALRVLYVGDSLGVGTTPQLVSLLGGQAQIEGNNRIGRPSPEGLSVLRSLFRPSDDVVVFDQGTNDDPAQPGRLAADLAAARSITGDRCLVVATLNRPPFNGVSIAGLNNVIESFAATNPGVQLVDWHAFAEGRPGAVGPDGIHATPQGYALRAQLFAQAIASCGTTAAPPTRSRPRIVKPAARPPRPRKPIKVPGIESSGISFTEPLTFSAGGAQIAGELLLPNAKPPYPAVAMLPGVGRASAEYVASRGIAALVWPAHAHDLDGLATEARAAIAALAARPDVSRSAVWALGDGAHAAALAAAGNPHVIAVVAVSSGLERSTDDAWRVRHALGGSGTAAIATWYRVTSGRDDRGGDPARDWQRVGQPVLAIWGTHDDQVPIRAAAGALRGALSAGRDRTFMTFAAGHDVATPRALAAAQRWLAQRLSGAAPPPGVRTVLPPANGGPAASRAAPASGVFSPLAQIAWLVVPALLFALALVRSPARRPIAASAAVLVAALIAIAGGVAVAVNAHGRGVTHLAGIPALFALAFVLAGAGLVLTALLARRRDWIAVAAGLLWLGLAAFWLL